MNGSNGQYLLLISSSTILYLGYVLHLFYSILLAQLQFTYRNHVQGNNYIKQMVFAIIIYILKQQKQPRWMGTSAMS